MYFFFVTLIMSVSVCICLLVFVFACVSYFFLRCLTCPFYTITVNKCTYLKNDLLCGVILLSIGFAAASHTHTLTPVTDEF